MNSSTAIPSRPSIALVGCGAIAERFYLPALRDLAPEYGNPKIVLIDNNRERAEAMAAAFGHSDVAINYHDVIDSVQGAIIAVPHHLHVAVASDFLRAGVHVLCEKPLAESGAEVREMIRLAKEKKVNLTANNTRRLVPSHVKVKQLLDEGVIGKLKSIHYYEGSEFDWPTASGFYFNSKISRKGVLLDVGAHALDALCVWLGGKPTVLSSYNDSFGGIEAVSAVSMEYNGCHCEVRLSRIGRLSNTFRIVGEKGTLEGMIHEWQTITLTKPDGTKQSIPTRTRKEIKVRFGRKPVSNLFETVTRGAAPLISAEAVLPSIELIEEAYEKAERFPMPWYDEVKELIHEY